ncbi:hypothetical protein COCSADRAFT_335006 [Bipolaris sorokiniana ND90Pr]|uniref:Uncharacterized protein n=1 Tax=Cochliobolus sativus (strain ND90Pr / ATCC 201652) TaxID=665912 RepID=M2SKP4_COCSN|nr:uncharacterized protein COCSADRAFT_335006 [Bipolaris sorokiniana ND90Pr]EMD62885.1 hypothetical protein COCSADRAFT_335006 [Bipolaris sorokiniana ND90Pr]
MTASLSLTWIRRDCSWSWDAAWFSSSFWVYWAVLRKYISHSPGCAATLAVSSSGVSGKEGGSGRFMAVKYTGLWGGAT